MDTDTPKGETAQSQPLDNNVTPTTTPVVNVDTAEVERLRKEAEQARMRANQLENELKKKNDAEAEARQKQLEEQQEYKTLYEQEKAERERLAQERELESLTQTIKSEEAKITAAYPQEVLDIAKELGFSLTDSSDEAVATFKAKLDKVSEKVGAKGGVTPNNTRTTVNNASREEKLKQYRQTGDPDVISQVIADLSFVKPYTQQ